MKRILLVEDDAALARGIALGLQGEAMAVDIAGSIGQAKGRMAGVAYDLLMLDINLPDGSGLDFCAETRGGFGAPVLFLTARDTEIDMVSGLEIGGDDYITKPFSLAVLRARVHALLRRGQGEAAASPQGFCFDFTNLRFEKNGVAVELSKTEQKLLRLLWQNRGATLARGVLAERIWPGGEGYVDENALSVAVRRLRAKLEDDPGAPQYIKTVYGVGYTWAVEP